MFDRFYKLLGPSCKSTNAVNFMLSLSGDKKLFEGLIADELTR